MAKKIVQDVMPPDRRSIRNIPLPESRSKRKTPPTARTRALGRQSSPTRNYTRISLWSIAAVCVVGLFYALSFLFVSATVTATPKSRTISVDLALIAKAEPMEGSLTYTMITVSKEDALEVPTSGDEKVEKKASGGIIVYNNHSSAEQTLVKNTRFETPDGLIFRIPTAITVPGKKSDGTPGSVKTTAIADRPGEGYNVGLADFTIPGFKSDPRYSTFSAKSDPSAPMAGGLVGTIKKVGERDMQEAVARIESTLKSDLVLSARAQIPSTHVLFFDAIKYSFKDLPQGEASGDKALIRREGTLHGVLLDRMELTRQIAEKSLDKKAKTDDIVALNLEQLQVVLNNKSEFDHRGAGVASFEFKGDLNIEWNINAPKDDGRTVQEELAGKRRSEIDNILSSFDSIEKAEVAVRPFWSMTLPKNPEKITVKHSNP